MLIGRKVVDQIGHPGIHGIADGNEMGKANVFLQRPIQNGRAQRARLGDESDSSLSWHVGREAGVQQGIWCDDAQTIGTDDPHAIVFANRVRQFLLKLGTRSAQLAKTGRQDHQTVDTGATAFIGDLWHRPRGGTDNRQIGWFSQFHHTGIGLEIFNFVVLRIDGVDRSGKSTRDHVPQDRVA